MNPAPTALIDPAQDQTASAPVGTAVAAPVRLTGSKGPVARPAPRIEAALAKPLHQTAQEILATSVRAIVGSPDAAPRPGQVMMVTDITAQIDQGVHATASGAKRGPQISGCAPTGVGKSAVTLSVACALAVRGERSVLSTESLALQAQIIDKDAPIITAAAEQVIGYKPTVAVLKGFSNFACANSTMKAATEMATMLGVPLDGDPAAMRERLIEARTNLSGAPETAAATTSGTAGGDLRSRRRRTTALSSKPKIDPETARRLDLVIWALENTSAASPGTGDLNTYTGDLGDGDWSGAIGWSGVAIGSDECVGDRCPFEDICRPKAARTLAAEADIVVTNHHLLAVQAANDVPVVIGSRVLGTFDHIFLDEAHGLPSIVRNQGSAEISGSALERAARAVSRVLDERSRAVETLVRDASTIADAVRDHLSRADLSAKIPNDADPLDGVGEMIKSWCSNAMKPLKTAADATDSPQGLLQLRRAMSRVTMLRNAVGKVVDHEAGYARWIDETSFGAMAGERVVRCAPVDVSSNILFSLFHRPVTDDDEEENAANARGIDSGLGELGDNTAPQEATVTRIPITAVCLSATLPPGFPRTVGLSVQTKKYPSPYASAYGNSMLYVPRAVEAADVEALAREGSLGPNSRKPAFDTRRHAEWAKTHMMDLIAANDGSALVLAATASSGREYAEAIRARFGNHIPILSQWDGPPLRRQVADWKADKRAVLIGTRSLMTGVDASGETCTLVIVDRPARAASNPVDDARVEALMTGAQMDRWAADRSVYVSDAGLLLEQSVGRLVRSINDSGMVAVLDPRLLKVGPFAYPAPTRTVYLNAVEQFTQRTSDRSTALAWLRQR